MRSGCLPCAVDRDFRTDQPSERGILMNDEFLLKKLNESGFPLHNAIINSVNDRVNYTRHSWSVIHNEHEWSNENRNSSGYIHIVLQHKDPSKVIVIECNNELNSSWIFFHASGFKNLEKHSQCFLSDYDLGTNRQQWFGWQECSLEPRTPEADYFVRVDDDPRPKPMLDTVVANLIASTEGLALEESICGIQTTIPCRRYFCAIVTTAKLKMATFDPRQISISDGTVLNARFTSFPILRFKKQIHTLELPKFEPRKFDSKKLSKAKEHSIFVVNANHFMDFLSSFDID